ncbi:bifunctional ADP-dependent NAD(P)H-hydrate dehydratase/NAD(P)H-hydrate epimerase [Oerskovia flava]|uniref:bifunctional ADP-dependent NAD(P)H-hydrate dehydratase/NAD(P)H-hydrate epimerase n=1 Tax=Oerskovia flava TaxID=2986422 RepID=UPI00223EB79D|nr:bifunctional ADP-dependent NAD(P)H-hydrate dehydratase/NAD(P)H-hydrate epimerase [Oerskovia sp. JB1-3-2]
MIEAWSVADVRAAEEPLLAAGVPLMVRAAFALATITARDLAHRRSVVAPDGGRRDGRVTGARVVALVGAGNNGGDTLFAGAYLARRGVHVEAICTSARAHRDGLAALRRAGGTVTELVGAPDEHVDQPASQVPLSLPESVERVLAADAVLDGLVGIGAAGPLRGRARDLVVAVLGALPDHPRRPWVVAVDTPSGIGVDDGAVDGPVLPADRTVTFGAAKPGLLLPPATYLAGRGAVVDLGLDLGSGLDRAAAPAAAVVRLEAGDVAHLWVVPGTSDHKYTRGVVGVVAGTSTFPGAAVLATTAAIRTGAGMVRYLGPDDVARHVLAARPEAVPGPGRVQAWVLGPGVPASGDPGAAGADGEDPGVPDDGGQHDRFRAALSGTDGGRVPAVVDAGALSLLPERCGPWVVLTPHAGELATLLRTRGEQVDRRGVEAEPLRWARRAHELTGATVLLKGSATVVVGPGAVLAQADAPGWSATAGSGDILAGILGTLLAAHHDGVLTEPDLPARLAAAAALVHGRAAERATPGGPVAALDVAHAVPAVVADLLAGAGR